MLKTMAGIALAIVLSACAWRSDIAPASSSAFSTAVHRGHAISRLTVATHRDGRRTDLAPDIGGAKRLLFVSDDASDDVFVYSLPGFRRKGRLTGFQEPQGLCSDAQGNVWVTSTVNSQIVKYSRTGRLLATLHDAGQWPVSCAVNQANGDLAVSNTTTTLGYSGSIFVYSRGSGTPKVLQDPKEFNYYFVGYDDAGNIYEDGYSDKGHDPMVSRCKAGKTSCSAVSFSGATLYYPGGIAWDNVGKRVLIGDQACGGQPMSCVYSTTSSGSTLTVQSTTILNNYDGTGCDVAQGAIVRSSAVYVGPCITSASSTSSVARWSYPQGGAPANYSTKVFFPIGSAISIK